MSSASKCTKEVRVLLFCNSQGDYEGSNHQDSGLGYSGPWARHQGLSETQWALYMRTVKKKKLTKQTDRHKTQTAVTSHSLQRQGKFFNQDPSE